MKNNFFPVLIILGLLSISCGMLTSTDNSNAPQPAAENTSIATPTPEEKARKVIDRRNYLSFGAGAVLVKFPVPSSNQFSSMNLFDEGEAFWISRENEGTDQVFIIGLPGETVFDGFSFMNGNDYYGEGSNAKDIMIEVSNTSADGEFQQVLETSLPNDIDPDKIYEPATKLPARFVKLTVKNSQGNPTHVSLGEFKGYGEQKTDASITGLTGTYVAVNQDEERLGWKLYSKAELEQAGTYSDIYLKQNGTMLAGCEEQGEHDYFNGGIDGSSAQLVWDFVPADPNVNAVMSFADKGNMMFVALLSESGTVDRFTAYQKKSNTPGKCPNIKGFDDNKGTSSQLAQDLEKTGRAVVYGINFDFNSDRLRDESKTVLNDIVAVLKENADWKMTVEGHTDSIGGEAFNQSLSDRRAASVKNYLTNAGIAADRLESAGFGLSKPVAPNDTEIGRARNRRVELAKQ